MTRAKSTDPKDHIRARLVVALSALEFGVPELEVSRPESRGPMIDFARQVAMYLSACIFGMTLTRVGELFSRDRSTVSHALKVVEDSRTDPVFDAKLERLEDWLGQVVAP